MFGSGRLPPHATAGGHFVPQTFADDYGSMPRASAGMGLASFCGWFWYTDTAFDLNRLLSSFLPTS